MKKSKKIALSSIISSISISIMLISNFSPFTTYAINAISGFFFTIIVLEINTKWAFASYLVSSIICLIIIPDKEASLLFVLFFGHYPIVKYYIESKTKGFFKYILKFIVFNFTIFLSYIIMIYVLNFSAIINEFKSFSPYVIVLIVIFSNVVFILYDYAISECISVYIHKFRKRIKNILN